MVRRHLFVHQQTAGTLRSGCPRGRSSKEADVVAGGGFLGVSVARCPGGAVPGARGRYAARSTIQAGEFSGGRTGCRVRAWRGLFAERASLVVIELRARVLISSLV